MKRVPYGKNADTGETVYVWQWETREDREHLELRMSRNADAHAMFPHEMDGVAMADSDEEWDALLAPFANQLLAALPPEVTVDEAELREWFGWHYLRFDNVVWHLLADERLTTETAPDPEAPHSLAPQAWGRIGRRNRA